MLAGKPRPDLRELVESGDAEICYVENGHLLDGPARWEALPVGWSWLGRWAGTSRVSDGGILILRVDSGAKE